MKTQQLMNPTDEQIRSAFLASREANPRVLRRLRGEPIDGHPLWTLNIMEHDLLERVAGIKGYAQDPVTVYRQAQRAAGVDFIDQWIPDNPLSIGASGYEGASHGATTGGEAPVLDGRRIEEPEDVVAHLEECVFPALEARIAAFDEEKRIREIGLGEYEAQKEIGEGILKTGYDYVLFPFLRYFEYGYVNYFCAYAMEPDVIARDFALQARLARLNNQAAAKAIARYGLPPLYRLDHDMTDSRGTLVDIRSLERIWFPHLDYALQPLVEAGVTLIWHCDGAITSMVRPLLEVGVRGFQGFQYEDGVNYEEICSLRTRDGAPLFVIAGASVTRTLPFGTPTDVAAELKRLVGGRGEARIALGCSSSIAPGVKWENLRVLLDGLAYYKRHTD